MKTPEDEAFDDLARRQGAWGGGFTAKRKMAADKQHWNEDEWRRNNWRCGHGWLRGEQCEICNAPQPAQEVDYWIREATAARQAEMALRRELEAQPAQELVATVTATVTSESGNPNVTMSWWHEPALPVGTKLYTAPPQREWVGLANEDWNSTPYDTEFRAGAEWAEAKLKEKNT